MNLKDRMLLFLVWDIVIQFLGISLFILIYYGGRFGSYGLLKIFPQSNFIILSVLLYFSLIIIYQLFSQFFCFIFWIYLSIFAKIKIFKLNLFLLFFKISFILPYLIYLGYIIPIFLTYFKVFVTNFSYPSGFLSNIFMLFNPLTYFFICLTALIFDDNLNTKNIKKI